MRLARISIWNRLAPVATLTLVAAFIGGCSGQSGPNGFIDPGAVGRFKPEPLVVKILSSLDTGVEEPSDEFANASDPRPDDLVAEQRDYTLGKDDLINVSITDLVNPGVETVKTTRISETGNISLPYIGQLRAEGYTEAQLEQAIVEAYRTARIVENAQVSVSVSEARSRTFEILGAVGQPAQYGIFQSDFRLLDALVTARDVTSTVGIDYIYVIRREVNPERSGAPTTRSTKPGTDILKPRSEAPAMKSTKVALLQTSGTGTKPSGETSGRIMTIDGKRVEVGEGAMPATMPAGRTAMPMPEPSTRGFEFISPMDQSNTRIIKIPFQELKQGDLRWNIVIKPQDLIWVPQPVTGEYYMDGHVARPGAYTLTARKIDLQQAVSAAGGYDGIAIPARTEIIRRIGNDQKVYALVDLDKISAGEQPDIYLKPNDLVRVGTNIWAPFVSAIRGAFRFTYGFGFLYDRNFDNNSNNNNGR